MNRRSLLKLAGLVSVAAVVAPSALFAAEPSLLDNDVPRYFDPKLPEYANYTNFSAFAISSSIDGAVSDAAQELAFRNGLMLNETVKHVDNRI